MLPGVGRVVRSPAAGPPRPRLLWCCVRGPAVAANKHPPYLILRHGDPHLTLTRPCSARPQAVRAHVLNPKAVRMGELYGEYNALTNEWADGLVGATRPAVTSRCLKNI